GDRAAEGRVGPDEREHGRVAGVGHVGPDERPGAVEVRRLDEDSDGQLGVDLPVAHDYLVVQEVAVGDLDDRGRRRCGDVVDRPDDSGEVGDPVGEHIPERLEGVEDVGHATYTALRRYGSRSRVARRLSPTWVTKSAGPSAPNGASFNEKRSVAMMAVACLTAIGTFGQPQMPVTWTASRRRVDHPDQYGKVFDPIARISSYGRCSGAAAGLYGSSW